MSEMTQAAQDVLAERRRQVEAEGWTPEHDDEHGDGELAELAAHYALHGSGSTGWIENGGREVWEWFKPKPTTRQNLVVAAALLLADIERLDRIV